MSGAPNDTVSAEEERASSVFYFTWVSRVGDSGSICNGIEAGSADTVGDGYVGTLIRERFELNSSQLGLLRTRFGRRRSGDFEASSCTCD